jgi:hypothetical protein
VKKAIKKGISRHRVSPAMIVGVIAVVLAIGGTATAALSGKDKKKVRSVVDQEIFKQAPGIADQQITKRAPGIADQEIAQRAPGLSVANASSLGGTPAGQYQKSCSAGAIKGSVLVDTRTLPATGAYATIPGFNCAGDVIQVRVDTAGLYRVRFAGGAGGAGSAVATAGNVAMNAAYAFGTDPLDNQPAFAVSITNAAGTPTPNQTFTLLAF